MTVSAYPNITPALTIRPTSPALEHAIANAIHEREQAVLFPPVEAPTDATPSPDATRLDARA